MGIKPTFDQHFGANLKTHFFAEFCNNFVTFLEFFQLFSTKNAENYYFDQRLGCHPNTGRNLQQTGVPLWSLVQSRCREGSAVTERARQNVVPREGEGGSVTSLPAIFTNQSQELITLNMFYSTLKG